MMNDLDDESRLQRAEFDPKKMRGQVKAGQTSAAKAFLKRYIPSKVVVDDEEDPT